MTRCGPAGNCSPPQAGRIFRVKGKLPILVCLLLGGCGYSAEELEAAFRDGHRAGIIWCKRDEPAQEPELDAELLTHWRDGFEQSVSVQCASRAAEIVWPGEAAVQK